ncbi:MAG TPA: 7-carboxy-7-deazaguanine synthase QueE [Chitinophagaceae bacterium]|nr:7-carboxy-7-deazaguanine synthase QueE [Chitinophagaceae bacterium]
MQQETLTEKLRYQEVRFPVMELFQTLQGEGFHQGSAACFIRLGGCDVGCTWCDVKESWPLQDHPLIAVDSIAAEASSCPARIAVVTGGEPLMHQLDPLTAALHQAGMKTHLETSGAYPLSGDWDWICLSPKKFRAPIPEICPRADELKVVVYHPSDLQWAERYASQVSASCRLYLQPEWSRRELLGSLLTDYIQSHPQWALSLQLHKYIGLP